LFAGKARIDQEVCVACGGCAEVCAQNAIRAEEVVQADAAVTPAVQTARREPAAASREAFCPTARPKVEILPSAARRNRLWPIVGSALVWAARELLPEVIAAWRAPRVGILRPGSRKPATSGLPASTQRRTGHRHRWGRA